MGFIKASICTIIILVMLMVETHSMNGWFSKFCCKPKKETIKEREVKKDVAVNVYKKAAKCELYLRARKNDLIDPEFTVSGIKYCRMHCFFPICEINKDHTLEKYGFELLKLRKDKEWVLQRLKVLYLAMIKGKVKLKFNDTKVPMEAMKEFALEHLKKQTKYANKNIGLLPIGNIFHTRNSEKTVSLFHADFAGLDENSSRDDFFQSFDSHKTLNLKSELEKGKPMEIINMWGPFMEDISQHILGFLPSGKKIGLHVDSANSIPIGMSYGKTYDPNMEIILKSNMKVGEVYIFRTSGKNAPHHASITIEGKSGERISYEYRFIVMKYK